MISRCLINLARFSKSLQTSTIWVMLWFAVSSIEPILTWIKSFKKSLKSNVRLVKKKKKDNLREEQTVESTCPTFCHVHKKTSDSLKHTPPQHTYRPSLP